MSSLQTLQNQLDPTLLSPLEYQLLQEYSKLLTLLHDLLERIYNLKKLNSQQLLDNLRIIETKLSLVFTLFKGSVYSLFLQTKMNMNGEVPNVGSETGDKEEQDESSSSINSGY